MQEFTGFERAPPKMYARNLRCMLSQHTVRFVLHDGVQPSSLSVPDKAFLSPALALIALKLPSYRYARRFPPDPRVRVLP